MSRVNNDVTDLHRAVLRALADTMVPSLDRPDDPTHFWALSGSELHADAGVELALAGFSATDRAGLLMLLEGLAAQGFTTASPAQREQLLDGIAQLAPEAAAAVVEGSVR